MSDTFAPLAPAAAGSREAPFTSIHTKGLAPGTVSSASGAPGPAGSGPDACSKPVVTLKRDGDTVSGIRIQCRCGQVVDLNCIY
jgi:hypothetical protein